MAESSVLSDRARIGGKAYGGGPIRVAGYRHPVVIDFAGLAVPASLPLLVDHENRAAARLGTVRARVEDGALFIDGEITATGDPARDIIAQARAGADEWHLSVGADPREVAEVRAGEQARINGRDFTGPLCHVKRASLREISVVAVGADAEAGMTIAAPSACCTPAATTGATTLTCNRPCWSCRRNWNGWRGRCWNPSK